MLAILNFEFLFSLPGQHEKKKENESQEEISFHRAARIGGPCTMTWYCTTPHRHHELSEKSILFQEREEEEKKIHLHYGLPATLWDTANRLLETYPLLRSALMGLH